MMPKNELTTLNIPEMSDVITLKFDSYPIPIQQALQRFRVVVFQVAQDLSISSLIETLKWDQLSYLAQPKLKQSSTIRIDWSNKYPEQIRIYFICNTLLVETFKELYPETFSYENNRAIVLNLNDSFNTPQLKHCLEMSLNYHNIKHLPLLGN
jgi:hypothetical protein